MYRLLFPYDKDSYQQNLSSMVTADLTDTLTLLQNSQGNSAYLSRISQSEDNIRRIRELTGKNIDIAAFIFTCTIAATLFMPGIDLLVTGFFISIMPTILVHMHEDGQKKEEACLLANASIFDIAINAVTNLKLIAKDQIRRPTKQSAFFSTQTLKQFVLNQFSTLSKPIAQFGLLTACLCLYLLFIPMTTPIIFIPLMMVVMGLSFLASAYIEHRSANNAETYYWEELGRILDAAPHQREKVLECAKTLHLAIKNEKKRPSSPAKRHAALNCPDELVMLGPDSPAIFSNCKNVLHLKHSSIEKLLLKSAEQGKPLEDTHPAILDTGCIIENNRYGI